MTSAINYNGVDSNFPLAGQDNDSQGFRDNFTYIRDGLAVANSEISELQKKVLLKFPLGVEPALGDEIPEGNDLGFSRLSNVITTNVYNLAYTPAGAEVSSPTVNISADGRAYYRFVVGNGMNTIGFSHWPVDLDQQPVYTKLRVEFVCDGNARTVAFAVPGVKYISGLADASITTTGVDGESIIIDVWSYNAGETIYFAKIGDFTTTA